MTQRLPTLILLAALFGSGLACGKYGPPVRSDAAQSSVDAPGAGAASGEACEEDAEKGTP